jgi:DNA-binding protein HU-beta
VNKAELIISVAKQAKLSQRAAKEAVEATLESIKKSTKREGVSIAGFGSFNVTKRKARMGRNPQTGASIKIKASKSVRFKPGKAFKDML